MFQNKDINAFFTSVKYRLAFPYDRNVPHHL